ncbi:MAG: GtrA family protein [Chitinophagia bacterium]|nr:GtrA family protein [Chitinophagia bacterium]
MRRIIDTLLDRLYPPFRSFINPMAFRYAACGGSNTAFDIFLFYIAYNFIFRKALLHLPFLTISPHIAAFLLSFSVTFPIGFCLNRYIVFRDSVIAGRVQLFRYSLTVSMSLVLNYIVLKFLVEWMGWYPTLAKIAATAISIVFSYLSQSYFTFRVKSYRSDGG